MRCKLSLSVMHQVSKKRAAELMLEELRKLPALPPTTLMRVKRKPTNKKKSRNLIKVGQEASIQPLLLFPHDVLVPDIFPFSFSFLWALMIFAKFCFSTCSREFLWDKVYLRIIF